MIKIKINPEEKEESSIKINLQIRKTLDSKLIITDHEDLDIIIDQDKGKIIVFSTDMKNSDKNYFTQDRIFKYLVKKGVVDPESVVAGNIYGCLEGNILKSKDNVNSIDVALLVIDKWIDEERPSFLYQKAKEKEFEDYLTEPDEEDTTPLGKVPHSKEKHGYSSDMGSMLPTQRPYEE